MNRIEFKKTPRMLCAILAIMAIHSILFRHSLHYASWFSKRLDRHNYPNTVWKYAHLDDYDLSYTNLERSGLGYGNFRRSRFIGTKFCGSEMIADDFTRADFRGADLHRSGWLDCSFRQADLRMANLEGAMFANSDFDGADLRGAYLSRADLSNHCGYNKQTKWPIGFDPRQHGATLFEETPVPPEHQANGPAIC